MSAHGQSTDPESGSNESRALTILSKLKAICSNNPNCGFSEDEIDHLSTTFEEVLFNAATNRKVLKEEIKMQESLKALGKDASAYMMTMFQNRVHRDNKEQKLRNSEGEIADEGNPEATRVVGHLIICKPSSSNIETTKGERLLGRRRVVGGYMLKKGETTKNWTAASVKRRYFILDDDELSYYRTESQITDEGSQMKLIHLKQVSSLRPSSDESAPALAIDMVVRLMSGSERTFVFAPEGTDEEMKGWAKFIADQCPIESVHDSIHTMSRETLALAGSEASTEAFVSALGINSGQVLEGWMYKKGETSKSWSAASVKRRYFVLQGKYLKYFSSDHQVNSQAPIKTIDLSQATFLGYTRDATAPGAAMDLKVRLSSGFERVFVFSPVGDPEKRINWATNIADRVPRVALDADLELLLDGFVDDDEELDREFSDDDTDYSRTAASSQNLVSECNSSSACLSAEEEEIESQPGVDHQGWMFKKGNTTRPWKKASVKKRFFVLQDSTLRYYDNPSTVMTNGTPKNTILLEQVRTLRYTTDKTAPPLAMDLEVSLQSGGTRTFTLSPAGEDWTQSSWGAVIRERVPQSAVDENFKEGTQAVDAHLKKQQKKKETVAEDMAGASQWRSQKGISSRYVAGSAAAAAAGGSSSPSTVKRSSALKSARGSSSSSSKQVQRGSGADGEKESRGSGAPGTPGKTKSMLTNSLQRLSMRVMRPSKRFDKSESGGIAHNWVLSKPVIGDSDDDDFDSDEPVQRRSTLSKRERTSLKTMELPPGSIDALALARDEEDEDDLEEEDVVGMNDSLSDLHHFATHTVSRSRVLSTDEVATQYRDSPLVRICDIQPANMAKLARHAQRLDDWDFDVFAVGEITKHPLVFVAYSLLSGFDMIHSFKLDESVVERYLKKIESCYTDTPYHNALHAADVTQNLNYFIAKCGLSTAARLGPELLLSCILTPVVHDVGHFGVNNPFLIGSSHDLAVRYNDQSPMENMHCATAFQAMQEEGHDVLAPLGTQSKKDVRYSMIQMVLATDNAMHTDYLVKFGNKIDDDECDFDQWEDQILVLQIALHAADVANPAKPRSIYKQWIERVMAEFYGQGDKEREQGMPVTPFLDRSKPIPEERFQSGFIKAIVQPLYIAFSRVDGFDMRIPLNTLATNLQWYTDIIDGQQ